MAFTVDNVQQFHNRGRDIVTKLAQAQDDFVAYARCFEINGGAAAINDVESGLGDSTVQMIGLYNSIRDLLAANNGAMQAVMDLYREDYLA